MTLLVRVRQNTKLRFGHHGIVLMTVSSKIALFTKFVLTCWVVMAQIRGVAAASPTFTNATVQAGINYQQGPPSDPLTSPVIIGITGGAAAGDFDGDGWVDLFVTRTDNTDILYRNLGNGQFADVSTTAFGATPIDAPTNGAAWGDIDNDGDLDLYVTTVGHTQHLLYMNAGDGTFSEQAIARGAEVSDGIELTSGTGIALGDYDRDGFLDIFVGQWNTNFVLGPLQSRLLHNNGSIEPGHFTDATDSAGVSLEVTSGPTAGRSYSFSPRFADLDGDRNPDLAIAGDFGTSRLFWNEGPDAPTRFSDGTAASGTNTGQNDMGSTIGDIDGDGRPDWFITDVYEDTAPNAHPNGNRLFHNDGSRQFSDVTDTAGVRNGDWGWGAAMFDYDNDSDLDITMTNGFIDGDQFLNDPMRLWENDGSGQFTEIGASAGVDDTGQGRGLLTFDYDNDGDLDIFVVNNGGQPVLLRNDGGNDNGYLRIDTVGTLSNRDGIGALIQVTPDVQEPGEKMVWEVNAGTHYLAQSQFTAHFGLGAGVQNVDEILILWPSGIQQMLLNVPADTILSVAELSGDFNANGQTDASDLNAWQLGYAQQLPLAELGDGDADGDGDVDGRDFLYWQQGFGGSAALQAAVGGPALTVPEPSQFALLMAGVAVLLSRRAATTEQGNSNQYQNY